MFDSGLRKEIKSFLKVILVSRLHIWGTFVISISVSFWVKQFVSAEICRQEDNLYNIPYGHMLSIIFIQQLSDQWWIPQRDFLNHTPLHDADVVGGVMLFMLYCTVIYRVITLTKAFWLTDWLQLLLSVKFTVALQNNDRLWTWITPTPSPFLWTVDLLFAQVYLWCNLGFSIEAKANTHTSNSTLQHSSWTDLFSTFFKIGNGPFKIPNMSNWNVPFHPNKGQNYFWNNKSKPAGLTKQTD